VWCAGSVAMIKDRSPDRARPCTRLREGSSQPLGAARRRFGRSSYSITASVGRVVSLNEILSHHRVVRGKRCNAQPRLAGPRTSAQAPICASSRHLGAAREMCSEERLFSHGVGRARRVTDRRTVTPPCGAQVAFQCSCTAQRAAHARAQAPRCARPSTTARREKARGGGTYCVAVSVGRVEPLNQRLSHHRVVRGQRLNTQTRRFRPFTRAQRLRGAFFVLRSRARARAILVTYGS